MIREGIDKYTYWEAVGESHGASTQARLHRILRTVDCAHDHERAWGLRTFSGLGLTTVFSSVFAPRKKQQQCTVMRCDPQIT